MPNKPATVDSRFLQPGMDVHVDLRMLAAIGAKPNPTTAVPCRIVEVGMSGSTVEGQGVKKQFVNHIRIVELHPELVPLIPKKEASK